MTLSDQAIEDALSRNCNSCGVNPGDECVHLITGQPLLDEIGIPVHYSRVGDQ